jgi:hydrogenase maturation protein HypF
MTVHITVFGIVQGVGYRPFVAGLAEEAGISGFVRNCGGIVEISASGNPQNLQKFTERLRREAPDGAFVLRVEVQEAEEEKFDGFHIAESGKRPASSSEPPLIPPDLPMCEECSHELEDPENRRYRYPFISCASCGPRYSIITGLPYDRPQTTMREFPMCSACEKEYTRGRRRHAQTISCHDCGPQLLYCGADGKKCEKEEALRLAAQLLKNGAVLALKGVGGYQFVCSPFLPKAVERLRLLKGREKKPFAVMFPSVSSVRECCEVSSEEEKLLRSAARPIVLLRKAAEIFCPSVSGDSRFIGAFLPYTGLHQILTKECGPLIATSANLTTEPILVRDVDVFAMKSPYLDGVLYNTREILNPLDDSVSRVFRGKPQLIRRSRGYVPLPILLDKPAKRAVFAAGGDLKSCFCLLSGDRAYLSQYFGDLESFGVQKNYREGIARMEQIFGITPAMVACDLHPRYFSSQLAQSEAERLGLSKPVAVQHHHAHAASVMAEHHLKSCIGVVFDGTGYGTDGTVWGGEFLLCRGAAFERAGCLSGITLCGGDEAAKNAAQTADCYRIAAGETKGGSHALPLVSAAVAGGINTFTSSSMGRLFDAAAAIFGIRERNSYEGECPIALENAATSALAKGKKPYPFRFRISQDESGHLTADQADFARQMIHASEIGVDAESAALGFHLAVAEMAENICLKIRERTGENRVALSGGVFANLLLSDECFNRLEKDGFKVYTNQIVPSNDGGISLGQAWICARLQENG